MRRRKAVLREKRERRIVTALVQSAARGDRAVMAATEQALTELAGKLAANDQQLLDRIEALEGKKRIVLPGE